MLFHSRLLTEQLAGLLPSLRLYQYPCIPGGERRRERKRGRRREVERRRERKGGKGKEEKGGKK